MMSENHDTTQWTVDGPDQLGMAIAALRREAQLTQADLADLAGLHRSYLSDLERGKAAEQTERLFRVLRRLGAEVIVRRRQP